MRGQWISASTTRTTGGPRGTSAAVAVPPDTARRTAAGAVVLALAAALLMLASLGVVLRFFVAKLGPALGMKADPDFEFIVRAYIADDLPKR